MSLGRVIRHVHYAVGIALCLAISVPSFGAVAYEDVVEKWSILRQSPKKMKLRHHWLPVLAGFREVALRGDPTTADRALYMESKLWSELYDISRRRTDLIESHRAALILADRYPASRLADDALFIAAEQARRVLGPPGRSDALLTRLLREHPSGDMASKARKLVGEPSDEQAESRSKVALDTEASLRSLSARLTGRLGDSEETAVEKIRSWRGKRSQRIVLRLNQPVEYMARRLSNTSLELRIESKVDPDAVREALKAAKLEATVVNLGSALVVRVKEDEHEIERVETFALEEPFRIILEVSFAQPEPVSKNETTTTSKEQPKPKPLVVLDPGHGGKDGGAKGHDNLLEKEIVLKIALNLERELKRQGIDVLLTRRDDRFISLEDRTAFANQNNADLFVSIHLNAHHSHKVSGVETYYLDTTDDKYALRLAATENQTSQERASEIQLAMVGLSMRFHTEESEAIAAEVQDSMVDVAKKFRKGGVRDLGVKSSLFYVLLGARMPAVLTEVGFITNPTDAELLSQRWYRRKLAASMAVTIRKVLSLP